MHSRPDAIILCGGAGTRLRAVTDSPKAMASVAGRPFLELLLRQLRRRDIRRVILATGYQGSLIQSHFDNRAFDLELVYSPELVPLGTGGALRNAADLLQSSVVLVMNGDSYTDADLHLFLLQHQESGADVSVLVVPPDGRNDCGNLSVDSYGRLLAFEEKQQSAAVKYINAGIYAVSTRLLQEIPTGEAISLERELFPQWLKEGKSIRAVIEQTTCHDIGTPERYEHAQTVLAEVELEPHTAALRGRL
jgi:mannose-1-phosphate guanylyltransferase